MPILWGNNAGFMDAKFTPETLVNRGVLLFKSISLCCCLLVSGSAFSQDLHFSQFHNAPLNLNPGLTGVFSGDLRFGANYREQWASVPVPYLTFSAAFDQKIYTPVTPGGLLSWGMVFNYDRAGDGQLSWSQIGGSASYIQQLAEEQYLSAGVQIKGGQRAFDVARFTFDDQFNGDLFDPTQSTQESFSKTSTGYFDFAAGANWFFKDEDSRTQLYAGVGFAHLNQPKVGFRNDDDVRLAMLTNAYTSGVIQVGAFTDLTFHALHQIQTPYRETVAGLGGRYHLKVERGKELALGLAFFYRMNDAAIGYAEALYQNWHFGLSYDINTSPFKVASQRRGGPEVSLRYVIFRVKPPEEFKLCPIF
ncbi:MAG: PorP/SprF family type IX secretion system membrane protein [Saprospiraceae bacterium]|nr:PorP/SprF family type IX secretion system membrane protein [Saprospiraceae bacterium]